ncbi:hypothetical protein DIPPA_10834 [Diplonema papillatum]|nr:hypothetical protein DIPPA_10834 [Diplonema papillatum]
MRAAPSVLGFVLAAAAVLAEPVTVLVVDFVDSAGKSMEGHPVLLLELNRTYAVGAGNRFTAEFSVGTNLTFRAETTLGHHETQGPTVTVPAGGLTGEHDMYVLQVPTRSVYDLFWEVTPGEKSKEKCIFVVTVCDGNKTVYDAQQGLPGSAVQLSPPDFSELFYFGVIPGTNDTDPLPNGRTTTSYDGGVIVENVPVDAAGEYVVTASHPQYTFTQSRLRCLKPGSFVNAAPNQGPRATPKSKEKCIFVVTVCDGNKTVYDAQQGLPGSAVQLSPPDFSELFYFGVIPGTNDKDPLPNGRTTTSYDGGVIVENVPVDAAGEYVVTASHPQYTFTQSRLRCLKPGSFVNAAPNQGPRATPVRPTGIAAKPNWQSRI